LCCFPNPAEGFRQSCQQVSRNQRMFAHAFPRDITSQAVEMDGCEYGL
jgi:hypothetical protein